MDIDSAVFDGMVKVLAGNGQLKAVIDIFDTNSGKRLATIRKAFTDNDRATVRDAAHALKGSCSMFGAKSCAFLCQELEDAMISGDQRDVANLPERIEHELRDFKRTLEIMINHPPDSQIPNNVLH